MAAIALFLGAILDFLTDPLAWVGIAALVASRRPKAVRYRRHLAWAAWIGCGIALFNSIRAALHYW